MPEEVEEPIIPRPPQRLPPAHNPPLQPKWYTPIKVRLVITVHIKAVATLNLLFSI